MIDLFIFIISQGEDAAFQEELEKAMALSYQTFQLEEEIRRLGARGECSSTKGWGPGVSVLVLLEENGSVHNLQGG